MLDLHAAFVTFPVLETERLQLRAVLPDDAECIFRIMGDAQVMRYFGQPPMASLDQALERVSAFDEAFHQQNGIRWAITQRSSGEFMGTCGFWRLIKPHFRAELGYELAPEWWGRGVMPEAAGAALSFGFSAMGLHSVEAQIHPANVGSRRVLEKLGFVQEGYFRENFYDLAERSFSDTAVFSLLKSAWVRSSVEL
jgi:ribosomal-protein-alanine N-acetyltransferase